MLRAYCGRCVQIHCIRSFIVAVALVTPTVVHRMCHRTHSQQDPRDRAPCRRFNITAHSGPANAGKLAIMGIDDYCPALLHHRGRSSRSTSWSFPFLPVPQWLVLHAPSQSPRVGSVQPPFPPSDGVYRLGSDQGEERSYGLG